MDDDTKVVDSGEEVSDTEAEDVKEESAEEAATTTSGSEQTSDDETEATETETLADGTPTDKPVPYSQFREANLKAQEAERKTQELEGRLRDLEAKGTTGGYDATKDPAYQAQAQQLTNQLKDMGFVTKAEQEAELERRDEDTQVQRELDSLESKYSGTDGRPKFVKQKVLDFALEKQIGDLEAAYKILNEKKLINWQIKQASSKTKGFKTETSTGTGSTEAGTTEKDLKDAIDKGDKSALQTYLKRRMKVAQTTK